MAVVNVNTWELTGVYFEGTAASGPVPIFFAENVYKASEAMDGALDMAFEDHQKLMRR